MELILECQDVRFVPGNWLLSLTERGATLTDSEGTVRVWIPIAQVGKAFRLPSWCRTRLGVQIDELRIVWFVPEPEKIAQIEDYIHSSWATEGAGALRDLRKKGRSFMFWGAVLLIGALSLPIVSALDMAQNAGSGLFVFSIGGIFFAAGLIQQGYQFERKARYGLKKLGQSWGEQ